MATIARNPADSAKQGSSQPVRRERGRGRPRADAKESVDEAALLRTAFTTFANLGYEAATMRAMARELGVSHNLLNVRFGKKSQLWKAAVDWRLKEAARDVEIAFDPTRSPEEQLRDLVFRFCRWAIINSDIVAISQQEGREPSWRLDYLTERFTLPFQRRLQKLLEQVASGTSLRPLGSSALLALLVHGVGSFFALGPLYERMLPDAPQGSAGRQTDEDRADTMAEFLLAGLFAG
nr:TetR/AcrR family transcriptional regulator [Croceicoccus hydrothermalis]